jgi:predicted NUDIX family phosphoesterase
MEEVLVIPAELVFRYKDREAALVEAALNNYSFMPRDAAETDIRFKQIIPYVVAEYNHSFLMLERLAAQSEKRLHGKLSLGIGGHINPVDVESAARKGGNVILAGLERELAEEVTLRPAGPPVFKGIISDETTEVGRVHAGFVFTLACLSPEFEIREKDKMRGEWAAPEIIQARLEAFESWSRMAFELFLKR